MPHKVIKERKDLQIQMASLQAFFLLISLFVLLFFFDVLI
jgi:hypothetical protein